MVGNEEEKKEVINKIKNGSALTDDENSENEFSQDDNQHNEDQANINPIAGSYADALGSRKDENKNQHQQEDNESGAI